MLVFTNQVLSRFRPPNRIGVAALDSTNVCRAQHPLGPRDQLPLPREGLCWLRRPSTFPLPASTGSGLLRWNPTNVRRVQHPLDPRNQLPLLREGLCRLRRPSTFPVRPPPDRGVVTSIHWSISTVLASTRSGSADVQYITTYTMFTSIINNYYIH